MSVSSTSPRTATITTGTTISQHPVDDGAAGDPRHSGSTPGGRSSPGGGGDISGGSTRGSSAQASSESHTGASATPPTEGGVGSAPHGTIGDSPSGAEPSVLADKRKKTTPPKKPGDRSSPTMRPRSTSQPILAIKPQPAPKLLGSPPQSPRSPRRLQSPRIADKPAPVGSPALTQAQLAVQSSAPARTQTSAPLSPQRTVQPTESTSGPLPVESDHTAPVLSAWSTPAEGALKPKQQAARDLADLIEKRQIRGGEAGDVSLAVDELSPALKKLLAGQRGDKVALGKLIELLFGKSLRNSDGWSTAWSMYVKFKIQSESLNASLASGNERSMGEAKRIIESYAASIAGAFFTLSRAEKLIRLPANVVAFLQEIDHRQLRKLLDDDNGRLDEHTVEQMRRHRIADVLIDRFLALQLHEAFAGPTENLATLILCNETKRALRAAFSETAARGLLAESLKQAPPSLATRFRQRRIDSLMASAPMGKEQGERKRGHQRRGSSGDALVSPRSPRSSEAWRTRMARKEWLSERLDLLRSQLKQVEIPSEVLKALKARNKALVGSAEPLSEEFILGEWQQVAAQHDPDGDTHRALRRLLNETLEQLAQIAEIQQALIEADIHALRFGIAAGTVVRGRARPLSMDTVASASELGTPDAPGPRAETGSIGATSATSATSAASSSMPLATPGEPLLTTTTNVTLTTTTSTITSTVTTSTQAAAVVTTSAPRAVPTLDLSILRRSEGSPYKPPASAASGQGAARTSISASQPASATASPLPSPSASPWVSPSATPLSSPQTSPRHSPERDAGARMMPARERGEGDVINSARRRLVNRRLRTASQASLMLPLQDSPRAATPRAIPAEQAAMISGFADAMVKTMRASAKASTPVLGGTTSAISGSVTSPAPSGTMSTDPGGTLLTASAIRSLAREEVRIPVGMLPAALREAMKLSGEPATVSHSAALQALTQESLRGSKAGKALIQMKMAVMQIHRGHELKLADWMEMANADALKRMTMDEMKSHAGATAHVSFGAVPSLAQAGLPPELLLAWKEADAHLCAWAAGNPQLKPEDVLNARSALGFDLVVTRSIYPLIYGAKDEAELALPGWFATVVREAHLAAWPAFFADFVRVVDAERATAITAASAN